MEAGGEATIENPGKSDKEREQDDGDVLDDAAAVHARGRRCGLCMYMYVGMVKMLIGERR